MRIGGVERQIIFFSKVEDGGTPVLSWGQWMALLYSVKDFDDGTYRSSSCDTRFGALLDEEDDEEDDESLP